MGNFSHVANNQDVHALLSQVESQPELWDKNPCRLSKRGPHYETQDMFLRYRDETPFIETNDWSKFGDEHIPIWNKTIDLLPAAKPLIFGVMSACHAEVLGGVFLYKLKPRTQIYPHIDKGWHPDFYDKFNICLQSNSEAAFFYEDEKFIQQRGDVHWFRNDVTHWVKNEGATDHIVLTVCVRLDKGQRAPWSPEGWTFDAAHERSH